MSTRFPATPDAIAPTGGIEATMRIGSALADAEADAIVQRPRTRAYIFIYSARLENLQTVRK